MFMSRFNIDILILDVTLTTKRWKKTIEIQHHTVRNTTQNMVLQWNQEISYWIHHRETEQDNLSNQVPPHQDSHEKEISRWTKRSDLRRRAKKLDNIANHQYPSKKTDVILQLFVVYNFLRFSFDVLSFTYLSTRSFINYYYIS